MKKTTQEKAMSEPSKLSQQIVAIVWQYVSAKSNAKERRNAAFNVDAFLSENLDKYGDEQEYHLNAAMLTQLEGERLARWKRRDAAPVTAPVSTGDSAERVRHHEMTPERWEELQAALDRPEGPTEAEAEEVLQHCGTSGRDVVNQFIEHLLNENQRLSTALFDLGIELEKDGSVSVEQKKFHAAICDHQVSADGAEQKARTVIDAWRDEWHLEPEPEMDGANSEVYESLVRHVANALRAATPPPAVTSHGIEVIARERQRHFEVEGWTPDHDDEHVHGELAVAAACYAVEHTDASVRYPDDDPEGSGWPWGERWWKPKGELRNLARAGALIAAEIDRLERNAKSATGEALPAVTEAGKQERELERVLSLLISYGAIHTVNGVTYPEGSHAEALKTAERIRDQLRTGCKVALDGNHNHTMTEKADNPLEDRYSCVCETC